MARAPRKTCRPLELGIAFLAVTTDVLALAIETLKKGRVRPAFFIFGRLV